MMSFYKGIVLTTIMLACLFPCLLGQSVFSIKGNVKDAATGKGIPSATAILSGGETKTVVQTVQTDGNGSFVFEKVPAGTFSLRISHIGYLDISRDSLAPARNGNPGSASEGVLSLNDLAMQTSGKILQEVEIVAKTPTIRSGEDKKVFSVNQSLVSTGGSASDLLQNVPTLQVDGNGNISLRGATNVKVLVDGKVSLIAGGTVAQILQSIPASSIERVEVITSPSAKYDASGQGIINIILKKNGKGGFNNTVSVGAGTRDNYNAGTSLNYKSGGFDAYANYNYRRRNTYSNGYQNMTYFNSGDSTYFSNEKFPSTTISNVHVLQAGIDYKFSSKDILSVSGLYNAYHTERDELLSIDNLAITHLPVQLSNRHNLTHGHGNSWGLSLDYVHSFRKPKEELSFDLSRSSGSTYSLQTYNTNIYNIDGQSVTTAPAILEDEKGGKHTNYNIQADYVLPAGRSGKLETGYRSQITIGDNTQWDYNMDTVSHAFLPAYNLINFFNSNDQIHAVYVSYRQQIRHFSVQVGLRGEIGKLHATLQNFDSSQVLISTPIDVNTKGLFPSLFLTQQFAGGRQLQLSYARRINRPTPAELNPCPDFSDPVNYDMGNPKLLPENINSIELTFKRSWSKITLTSGLYYNQINNVIKHIESNPVNDVIITTPQNLKRSINTGVEFIGSFNLIKVWSFTANLNGFERINSAAPLYGISATQGFSWNANITNDFAIRKDLALQLRADYKASDVILQDRDRPAFGLDAGARYDFADHKASLVFSASDIFNSRRWRFLRVSDALLLDFERVTYSARANLTFTYRFGGSLSGAERKKRADDQQGTRIENR